jgi:fatty-acyl-CoA synthase
MQPDMNWVGVLEHHARRTPDKPLAVLGDDVVTYRQMTERAAALATGLAARGVGAGDVVALLFYNSLEFLETIFAANHLGAVAMPINWRLAAAEVAFILDHSQARVFVCDEELFELGADAADRLDGGPVRVAVSAGTHDGWERLADLRATSGSCTPRGRPGARRA